MTLGKAAFGAVFVGAGLMHFVATAAYMKIMPPMLPDPRLLVQISGAFEVLGGIGLLVPATQRLAAWGLVALLVAVLPANVYMAMDHAAWPNIPVWLLWVRVPLQVPLIWWACVYTRSRFTAQRESIGDLLSNPASAEIEFDAPKVENLSKRFSRHE